MYFNIILQFIILQNDRSVEFHDRRGILAKKRIPKSGRDLAYHRDSADLLLVGSRYVIKFDKDWLVQLSFIFLILFLCKSYNFFFHEF